MIWGLPIVISSFGGAAMSAIRAGPTETSATSTIWFVFTAVILNHWLFKRVIHIRARITGRGSRYRRGLICHRRMHFLDRVRGCIAQLFSGGEDKGLGRSARVRSRLVDHFPGRHQGIIPAYFGLMIATAFVVFFVFLRLNFK